MSHQAHADLESDPDFDQGQADAGAGGSGVLAGRESEPSSATPHEHGPNADGDPSAGSGRAAGADVLEEMSERDRYLAMLDSVDIDSLPDEDPGPSAPAAEEVNPPARPAAPDPDADDDPEDGRPKQYRLRPKSALDARTFALMKADPDLELEDAIDLARASLKMPPRTASTDTPADPDPADTPEDTAESAASIEARIKELRQAKLDAKKAYDVDKEVEIEEALLALEEELPAARQREAERTRLTADADEAFNAAQQAAWAEVIAKYPEADDENGAFAMLMLKLDDDLAASQDPLFDDPNKAVALADRVAKLLNVSGSRPAAPAAPARGRSLPAPASSRTSAPATRPGPAVMSPASGSARTAADSPTQLEVDIARVSTPEQYEAVKARVLAGV